MEVLKKLSESHVLTGIVFGALIGLYHPLDAYKGILLFLGVVMGISLVLKTK